jgi:chorismate mutase/prephenate dehydratase
MLTAIRRQIDQIDVEIVRLMNKRARLAQDAGKLKDRVGAARYSPEREQEVINQAVSRNEGPLPDEAVCAVFRELVSAARAVETPIRVAYLGPEYSYSHLAAIHRFGQSVDLVPVASIAAVFEEVSQRHTQFGVVPMENSTDGRVSDTLEMFARTPVRICGEVPLHIHHHLLGRGTRGEVKEVVSKPQALSQCRNWIARHLPGVRTVEVASTSEAAQRARETPEAAAIASLQAGVNYQLDILARNIEDNPGNLTRFAVIGDQAAERTGDDKTALMFEIPHQPGALADATAVFKRSRLNMTWIESFPIPGHTGRYLFFVEFVGHHEELRARRAIAALGKKALRLEVLGSYARMEPIG